MFTVLRRKERVLRLIASRCSRLTFQRRENSNGVAIIEQLRKEFADKKQQHIAAAERDHAKIFSVSGITDQYESHNQHGIQTHEHLPQAIYGFGVTSPNQVFINNELNLKYTEVYGFDYDYTLANYTDNLSRTIYDILRDILVDMLRYPKHIKDLEFDPSFAIRGLHYDINTGWLMKIDSYANIQLNTVHAGRDRVSDPEEVIRYYNGTHIAPRYLQTNMFQLNDLFSIPQACLLSDVQQYFKRHNISFHPRYLSDDLNQAARILHTGSNMNSAFGIGGRLHHAVLSDIPNYLEKSPQLVHFLKKLKKNGKKTFLLTNSSLPFIDKGMQYLTSSPDWRDLFDCVIVSARKPDFYRSRRPFRRVREPMWDPVHKFEKGEVYQGGNLTDFSRITGWSGQKVLYFGDHIFSDLIDPTVEQGWRTGAIIHELAAEIETRNTSSYRHSLAWLLRIERLIVEAQSYYGQPDVDGRLENLINEWSSERRNARHELRNVFNRSFGSVFRTYQNPTYFANKIRTFADIYMSNVANLNHVSLDYVFYPDRTYLPHERLVETLIDTGKIKELLRSS
ncbi:5' nucleotidase family-domain-containing protein [Zychaea mexicana]|uniref:5' nucleotidase family-domain-containing protein n=1 Tax=Zychaea mexicana TaxID=64656 RepID=UPI0022FF4261|nr:5' nucleotidase family-domain-containing protein [Zychaea mexicana]KAI9497803.1 5' nucleotidase family-domain-containing protein [Zychaea mexicana]